MTKHMFERVGNEIFDVNDKRKPIYTGTVDGTKSVSAAKRESRKLQIANDGFLGRGCLSVVRHVKAI